MKLIIIESDILTKKLVTDAIDDHLFEIDSFSCAKQAFLHIRDQTTPFLIISEVLRTNDLDLDEIYSLLKSTFFRGVLFISQYGDEIIATAKQIANDLGFNNIDGLTLPLSSTAIRNKINRTLEFDNAFESEPEYQQKLTQSDILYALDHDLFEPFYQAQIDSRTGDISGYELLARLKFNNETYLPAEFIHEIVDIQRISEFTFKLLRKSLSLAQPFHLYDGSLSINIDYQSLGENNFAKQVIDIVDEYQFPKELLIFEITENSPVINIFVMNNLNEFRMAGCSLSIDDFGTQNSGFTELLKLPFSELKIDKSFVNDVCDSARAKKVIKALVAVAESLDCRVVAEGVENEQQAAALTVLGVGTLQGFFYSRPVPINDLAKIDSASLARVEIENSE